MSGSSYCYIYQKLYDQCHDHMYDVEMNHMIDDLCDVLHDLEWWISSDYSEDQYRDAVSKFKEKWFYKIEKTRTDIPIDRKSAALPQKWYDMIVLDDNGNVLSKGVCITPDLKSVMTSYKQWLGNENIDANKCHVLVFSDQQIYSIFDKEK